jgi:hypothetical protein
MGDVVGMGRMTRVGIEVDDVVLDWLLGRPGAEHLRDAVTMLLASPPNLVGAMEAIADACRREKAKGAVLDLRGPTPVRHVSLRTAEGVAQVFGLTALQRAALIELRWAAFARSVDEIGEHLEQAARRLAEAIDEAAGGAA